MTSRTRIFRYVPIGRIDAYLDCGWHFDGTFRSHHDDYAAILEWLCCCREPVEPLR
jgi:hypothetical protein